MIEGQEQSQFPQVRSYRATHEEPYTPPQELLIRILDRSSIPNNIAHMLKGEVWEYTHTDSTGNVHGKWMKKGKIWLNDDGIQVVISIVGNYTSVDKLATNITIEEARQMTYMLKLDMLRIFATKWVDYEIEECDRSLIVRMVVDTVFINLTSSREATILNLIKPVYQHHETYEPQKKEGGFWSFIPFMGGK